MENIKNKIAQRTAQARKKAQAAKKELDQKILELTALKFEKIKELLAERQKKWEEDGDVMKRLAGKILNRASNIKEALNLNQVNFTSPTKRTSTVKGAQNDQSKANGNTHTSLEQVSSKTKPKKRTKKPPVSK